MNRNVVLYGDCLTRLKELTDACVQTCVTSPPYFGLRDYGVEGQIGLEPTPDEYVAKLVEVFREVKRVLRDDGTLWLNLGDSYSPDHAQKRNAGWKGEGPSGNSGLHSGVGGSRARDSHGTVPGLKPKDLVGIPWRVAFALQADGWYLRQDIIWHKPNPMPESVNDRCTKAHEYIFLLSKSARYFYDAEAVREPAICDRIRGPALHADTVSTNGNSGLSRRAVTDTRNKRSVWTVNTKPYKGAHFAVFPPELPTLCIKAGSKTGDLVLDPFAGSGTTLEVAKNLDRDFIGVELNEEYRSLLESRIEPALEAAQQRSVFRLMLEMGQG